VGQPTDLENQYTSLFGYLQDWTHGGPVAPWQSVDSNARGFLPMGSDGYQTRHWSRYSTPRPSSF